MDDTHEPTKRESEAEDADRRELEAIERILLNEDCPYDHFPAYFGEQMSQISAHHDGQQMTMFDTSEQYR